jgi:Tfp pilus assembly protein PilO
MRLFIPIILVVAAIGLFVVYTNPTYQATKALASQVTDYNNALDKSKELRSVRDKLLSKRNTFSATDVQKIGEVLPDNVDNIRLIIDINNIASRHGLVLSGVQIGDLGGKNSPSALTSTANSGPVGSVTVGFTIDTTYDNMLTFIADLEHSLRLIDVEKMTFTATPTGSSSFFFTIRTYWLH